MFTGADENFVARDFVGAIGQGFGLGAHQAQIGAAMRLGQAHGTGPFATGHFVQISLLLHLGTVAVQCRVRTMREAGVHGPSLVGAVEHFIKTLVDHQRQALAAKGRIAAQCRPAAFHIFGVRLFKALGRGHGVCRDVKLAAFFVTADIERENDFRGELRTFFQYGIDGAQVCISILGNWPEFFRNIEHFVHDKLHVAQGRVVNRHVITP